MNQDPKENHPQEDGPVTVSIARKIKPGFESQYETWEKEIIREAASFPGYMGTSFLRPNSATRYRYIIIYRFDSYQNAVNWEESEERQGWLEKVQPILVGKPELQQKSGLEVWFELPEIEVTKPAPRWKMAIVLTVVLYILSISLNILLRPILIHVSLPINIIIILIINVILMTWVIMPKLTYWLRNWLYK
jgi:antibiotic biosynthesis monooxygenase (ABM) superfamily enzyme